MGHALGNWAMLIRYTQDGDLEIDNYGAERSLWDIAVGRKNWLFSGCDTGGRTVAILTGLVTTCKRLQLHPFAYLRDVFVCISVHPAHQREELLQNRW
jgi:hypothetical protein